MAAAVQAHATTAEATQVERAIVEWMTVLAQADTGRGPEEGGSDLTKDGSGRSYWDQFVSGGAPRGVLRVFARFEDGRGEPTVTSSEAQGVNEELVAVLNKSGKKAAELGMPVFVAGVVAEHLGGGSIEAGQNEAGAVTYTTGGYGERILETLGDGSAEQGAARVVSRVSAMTLDQLGTEAV